MMVIGLGIMCIIRHEQPSFIVSNHTDLPYIFLSNGQESKRIEWKMVSFLTSGTNYSKLIYYQMDRILRRSN